MKKLIILLFLPALLLIGCGEMNTNDAQVGAVTSELADQGYISDESQESMANLNDPTILDETLTVTETSESSMMMKVGGVELLVEFIDQADIINEDSVAMIINGIEVVQEIAADPSKLQGLLASIVSSVTQDIDIFGVDVGQLVSFGLDLINGNAQMSDLSSVFGVLVEGALNMFLSSVPFGGLIAALAGPVIDGITGNNNSNNNSNANSGSGLSGLGDAVSSIIGSLTGNNNNNSGGNTNPPTNNNNNNNSSSNNNDSLGGSLFNGIFNLITNLF